MNPLVREAIIRSYDSQHVWMEDNLPAYLKQQKNILEGDTFKTMQMMKDAGELVPHGTHGLLRLSLKAVESQAPFLTRFKKGFMHNWIAISAVVLSLIADIIALVALLRK